MIIFLRAYAVLLLCLGFAMIAGGIQLLWLNGSPYSIAGLALISSAVLLWLRRAAGATLYGLLFLATPTWAIWEIGLDGWALLPRLFVFTALGAVLCIPALRRALVWRGSAQMRTP